MEAVASWATLGGAALWAFAALVVAGVAILRRSALGRGRAPEGGSCDATGVALLRPCAGAEPWLHETLTSVDRARCAAPLTYRVTVADEADAARPVAEAACAELRRRGHDAEVWVVDVGEAPNHKAAQIAAAIARLPKGGWVMSADSDVDLSGVDLGALQALAGAGVAWMPPAEHGPIHTLGDRASQAVLDASLHAFPLLCAIDPQGLVGKLFALSPAAVGALEGFAPLVDYLGEDMELSRRVLAAGLPVRPSPEVVPAVTHGRALGGIITRYGRWMTVIRAQRPALLVTYPLFFFPLWPVASLATIGASASPALATGVVGIAAATRLWVAASARRLARRPFAPWAWIPDVLLAEAVLTASFVRALGSRRVTWRGRALKIDRSGRLAPDR